MSNALVNELNSLKEREENLQKEILQLSQENLGLKFEVEQGSMRLPQYIDRISHLEKYINALKSESKCDHVDTPSIQLQKPRV